MLNDEKEFNNIVKVIKIRNLENKFYNEFDYIKDIEFASKNIIHKKGFLNRFFGKKFEIYKTGINNRKRIEIFKIIKESKMYKLIHHINTQRKADFFNIEIILQEKNFLLYAIENSYIEKSKLENLRNYLIDIEFEKNSSEYNLLIRKQNEYKNKIDDILDCSH